MCTAGISALRGAGEIVLCLVVAYLVVEIVGEHSTIQLETTDRRRLEEQGHLDAAEQPVGQDPSSSSTSGAISSGRSSPIRAATTLPSRPTK